MMQRVQPRQGLLGLKILVSVLGVLIVLGTALVIGVVIHRLYASGPVASMPQVAAPVVAPVVAPGLAPGLAPAVARLAPGERILGIAGAGGELAIWVGGPGGGRVLLLDPASGRLTPVVQTAP